MLPLEARIAAGCGLFAVLLAAILWTFHHERQIGAAQCRADVAAATADAQRKAQDRYEAQVKDQAGVASEADRLARRARDDAASADLAARRLLHDTRRPAACSAAAPASAPGASASASDVVPAELLDWTLGRLGATTAALDAAYLAGQACERSYDAVKE
jgi:Protein of unknown function (DUF2514)